MKIVHLLSGLDIALTNQERTFVESHKGSITIENLSEHDQWLAQNLVRKGIYSISKDSQHLIKKVNESNT
jgi:hypothetical protein